MQLSDAFLAFKRFALYEKNLSSSYVKDIFLTVRLLEHASPLENIKQYDTDMIASFLQQMRQERLWSAKTMRNYRQHLKTYFDFLVRKGHCPANPIDDIAKPKLPKSLPRCLSKSQIKVLLAEAQTFRWKYRLEHWRNSAIIYTFFYTGIRMSELLNLKTHDVNFEERYLYVHQGKGNKDRYVPLHPKLIPILKFYRNQRDERLPVSSYFFTSIRSGKPLTQKNLYAVFHKLSKGCGFRITPHMLRHTMAKLSLEANLNPFTLKEILGHSNIATTQIYMSISTENINRSFSKLNLL